MQGNEVRVDTDFAEPVDEAPGDVPVLAETEDDVGAHAVAAKNLNGLLKGFEITDQGNLGLAGRHAAADALIEALHVHGDIGHAELLQLLKNTEVDRRLELELNRKARALRDGLGALSEIQDALIAVHGRAARECDMRDAVKALRGLGYFGELLRRFLRYRGASLQAASESAETAARLGTGVAQAGLQDCRAAERSSYKECHPPSSDRKISPF